MGTLADVIPRPRGDERPYRERRTAPKNDFNGEDKRQPRLSEFDLDAITSAEIRTALVSEGVALSLDVLVSLLESVGTASAGALRAGIEAANDTRKERGLRPEFTFDQYDHVSLTEWACPDGYLALESVLLDAVAELRESVRRALLDRVAGLEDHAFCKVITTLLSRMGYTSFREVHRTETGQVMLTARRGAEIEQFSAAIIAQSSWAPIDENTIDALRDSLGFFNATTGIVLTVGNFTPGAVSEATRPDDVAVQLVDGEGLARLFYRQRMGVQEHSLDICYPDEAFFAGLEE
jgi:hypothetical protein